METTIFFLILLLHISATASTRVATTFPSLSPPRGNFSALFVFGDSIVDTGNNDYIGTILKANYPPYGSAFPNHTATGRFSNGKLVGDYLVAAMGIKELIPPFLNTSLSDEEIRTGVVFASAGSGYDEFTTLATGVVPVMKQPEMFKKYLDRVKGNVGEQEASRIARESLVLLCAGTNDFTFNFYDLPTRKLTYNMSGYQDYILQRMQDLVKLIYDLGPRKFAISGLPPIGCLPLQMSLKFMNPLNRTCIDEQNSDSVAYDKKLAIMVPKLQASLPGSKIVYVDIYAPLFDMATRPSQYGFTESKKGCCGTGYLEFAFPCNPLTPACPDPSKYVFWDAVHPTEACYQKLAKQLIDKYLHLFY